MAMCNDGLVGRAPERAVVVVGQHGLVPVAEACKPDLALGDAPCNGPAHAEITFCLLCSRLQVPLGL
eukprot:8034447-Heterocapsa_arctica.AAC.1